MARYEFSTEGIGVLLSPTGDGLAGVAFVTSLPLYAAATGGTLLTTGQKVTGANGLAPGWVDPAAHAGSHTIAYGAGATRSFIVGELSPPTGANVRDSEFGPGVIYNHGALGDGAAHPLSDYFATLGAAQVVYPHVVALTDTLDWAAIQAAINAYGAVDMPQGDYMLSRTLKANKHNIALLGRGAGQFTGATQTPATGTRLRIISSFVGTEVLRVALDSGATPVHGALLRDFAIDGELIGPAALDGILLQSNRALLDNVTVHRMKGDGIRVKGTAGFDTYDTELRRPMVFDCAGSGLRLDTDAADVQIMGGVSARNLYGIRIGSASVQITGVHTYDSTNFNIWFDGSGSRSKLVNMKIEGAGQHGVLLDSSGGAGPSDVQIVGCQFHDNGDTTTNTYDHICSLGTAQSNRLNISGCNFGWKNGANPNKPRYAVNAATSGAVDWKVSGCVFGALSNFGTGYIGKASSASIRVDIDYVGTPETFVFASIGSRVSRTDGGAATSHYFKETGTLATGWVGK